MQRTTRDYYEYLYQQIGQPRRSRNIPTKQEGMIPKRES